MAFSLFKKKKTELKLKGSKLKTSKGKISNKKVTKITAKSKSAGKKAKVIVYSTKTCPWCAKTKKFLKANKIPFTNKDVGDSSKAAQEMMKKSGQQGVPVTDINGTIIIGFNEGKLKRALKL